MNPVTHFLTGWAVANTTAIDRRDRLLVSIASIAPDVDGLGMFVDLATRRSENPTGWWGAYHHVLGHNLGFVLFYTGLTFALSKRRWITSLLAFLALHVHLLCDVLGSRGPDGYQWPIPYLLPFSDAWQLSWSGQWPLTSWQNFAVTGAFLALMFYIAWSKGVSPLEFVCKRADRSFVQALRARFKPRAGKP